MYTAIQEKDSHKYSNKFNCMSAESSKKLKIKYISKPLDKQELLFYNDKYKDRTFVQSCLKEVGLK